MTVESSDVRAWTTSTNQIFSSHFYTYFYALITDIDECLTDNGQCKNGANCTNLIGNRMCHCTADFAGSDCSCPAGHNGTNTTNCTGM